MKKYIFSIIMLLVSMTMAAQDSFKTVKGQVVDAATQ